MALAKQQSLSREQSSHQPALLTEQRAWELFAKAVDPNASPTRTPEHIAEVCFDLATSFESIAEARRTRRDGETS